MRFQTISSGFASIALVGSCALIGAPTAMASDYKVEKLLTAEQVQQVLKTDQVLEASTGTFRKNSVYASYRVAEQMTGISPYSITIYKYQPPKPSSKPTKPDPNAPKFTCKTFENAAPNYTGVCWNKTSVNAYSSTSIGKTIVSASVNLGEYNDQGQPMPVASNAKMRQSMAKEARALRDAQVRKLKD
jgi:hypothetical protein